MSSEDSNEINHYVDGLLSKVVNDFVSNKLNEQSDIFITEDEPVVAEEEPVVAEEEPIVVKEEPVVVEEEPVVVEEEPVVVAEEPVVVEEEHTAVEEEPVAVAEEPVVVKEKPVVVEEEHTAVEEEPEEPVVVEEEPIVVAEEPVVVAEEPVVVEEEPVVAEEEPVAVKEEPVVVENIIDQEKAVDEDLKKKITSLEKLVSDLLKKEELPIKEKLPKNEKLPIKEIVVNETIVETIEEIKQNKPTPVVNKVPDIVLIVPYRDRAPQRSAFMKIMPHILEDLNCKVLFIHQRDNRPFNRGAMKNLGFIYVKNMYPTNYKDITLVFHDIDNIPWHKGQFSYQTQRNIVNHFYGYHRALGGIFAIKAWDFEHINGFPNIWTWGLEDNIILRRAEQNKKRVIRPEFVNIEKDNNNIIGLWHGWDRLVNPHIEHKGRADRGQDGIRSLRNIRMNPNEMDNLFIEVNITSFHTGENLTSPFVKGARKVDARTMQRLNRPFYVKGPKRGTAGTFGKKKGFGGMAF